MIPPQVAGGQVTLERAEPEGVMSELMAAEQAMPGQIAAEQVASGQVAPAIDEGTWQARAALWELLALSFGYPRETLCESVASGEWAQAASELLAARGVSLPDDALGQGATCAARSEENLLHVLRVEHTRLFVGSPAPVVAPYESIWRAQDEGVEALLFVNPHAAEVERCCNRFGLGKPKGVNEPLDCIDAECELLEHLALGALGLSVGTAPDVPQQEWPGAYESFLRDHAGCWMERFADGVAAQTRDPFYRHAAAVLKAVVVEECRGEVTN